eukprot:9949894-Alexandrium_andersonii.AAC.1
MQRVASAEAAGDVAAGQAAMLRRQQLRGGASSNGDCPSIEAEGSCNEPTWYCSRRPTRASGRITEAGAANIARRPGRHGLAVARGRP